jgi:nucleosome assembly protein 1-like 1
VLAFLKDVRDEDIDDEDGDPAGFRLTFAFAPNPFFSDAELTLTYRLTEEQGYMQVQDIEGTKVHWAADKDVTVKKMKKKPKAGSKAKALTKLEPVESFFRLFTDPPQVPEPEEAEGADEDEEMEALQEEVEHHVAIGELIRERIIPHAVEWFTGAALAELEDEESEEEEEEDDEEEGDDDEEEEEEDSEDDGPAGAPPADSKEQPQECKQQ